MTTIQPLRRGGCLKSCCWRLVGLFVPKFTVPRGAGNAVLPIAAGAAHGTSIQEGVIALALRSAAVSLIAGVVLVLWGLRAVHGAQPRR